MRQVIGLLLDSSGSMEEDLPLLQEAAIKFLTNIPRTEHLFVISFDESIWLSEYSSDDQRTISNRIYEIEAGGLDGASTMRSPPFSTACTTTRGGKPWRCSAMGRTPAPR